MKINAEDNISKLHNQMKELVSPNSAVIEFGCGKGDLLIQLSSKIRYGKGIDKSERLIETARKHKQTRSITNVDFVCKTLGKGNAEESRYDFSIASLFFHVISHKKAVYLLKRMTNISNSILICGFSRPRTFGERSLLWLDQRFSKHYKNFKEYQKKGYMEGLLKKANVTNSITYNTSIPFVKIYKINS